MPLKARNDIHLARRFWHTAGVLTILGLYSITPPQHRLLTVLILCGTPVLVDVLRQFLPTMNAVSQKVLGTVMRESERNRLSGMTYMLLGSSMVILVAPHQVVYLTLWMFAVADPLASYFGIRYGKERLLGTKTLQGTAAAFCACFAVSVLYFSTLSLMHERLFIVALLSGLIGAFAELLPIGKIDDNFTFPVVSATLLYGVFYLFGGL